MTEHEPQHSKITKEQFIEMMMLTGQETKAQEIEEEDKKLHDIGYRFEFYMIGGQVYAKKVKKPAFGFRG